MLFRSNSDLAGLLQGMISPAEALYEDIQGQISALFTSVRLDKNMTQKEFADLLGIKQSQVSRWESGKYNFTIKSLSEVAVLLDKRVNIVISDINNKNKSCNTKIVNFDAKVTQSKTYKTDYKNAASAILEG